MSIVIFTGAGASKPLGFPTTLEFYNTIDNTSHELLSELKSILNKQILDAEEIFEILKNIEDFLVTPAGRFLTHKISDRWFSQARGLYNVSKYLCFKNYSRDVNLDDVRSLYLPLLNHLDWNNNKINLYTTNYDIVPEKIIDLAVENNIEYYDGFDNRGWWQPDAYSKLSNGIKICNLHGSVYWIKENNKLKKINSLRNMNISDFILYPAFKDNPKDLDEWFALPHETLIEDLANSKTLIIIGFSFRDEAIKTIITKALNSNQNLNIYLVNQDRITLIEELSSEFPNRIKHIGTDFENKDYLKELKL